ncbi:hypothetical protein COCMIDRAFT_111276, partial [Bipolaris oryzae ATCC 44560]
GLGRAVTSGKTCFNSSDSPLFNEVLIATISLNPSNVICYLSLTKQKILLNNSKSICFCVKSGYYQNGLLSRLSPLKKKHETVRHFLQR